MTIMAALGWWASAYIGMIALPAAQLTKMNHDFSVGVDAGDSCWDRTSGTPGIYGHPSNYSLDLLCNYRLTHEVVNKDVKVWRLSR